MHAIEDPLVGAVLCPAEMAFPHGLPRAELDRQVPPRRTRAIPPRDALQRPPMISPRASRTTLGGRQQRLHNSLDLVREHPTTHHSKIITDEPAQDCQTLILVGRSPGRDPLAD